MPTLSGGAIRPTNSWLVGLSALVIDYPAMFRGMWALYIHSNVSLDPGPLRYLIGAPRLHQRFVETRGLEQVLLRA